MSPWELLAAAAAGAAVGSLSGRPWVIVLCAVAALPACRLEAAWWRRRGAPPGAWLAWGYLPLVLLFLHPLLTSLAGPAWQSGPQGRVADLHARAALAVLSLALCAGARAWAVGPLPEGGSCWGRRVLAVAAGAGVIFSALACLAAWNLHKYVDLANDNELLTRMSRGEGPRCLLPTYYPSYPRSGIYWAQHFTVLWALVAPGYRVLPAPYFVLCLHALVIAGAAVPLYLGLRPRIGGLQAAGLAFAFLLYPTTQHAILHEVHGLSLAVPFTAGVWWAARAGRWGWAAACALLALACREEIAFIGAGLGLAMALEPGRRGRGLLLAGLSAAWFLYLTNHLMPSLGGDRDWRTYKFASLGSSHDEILHNLLAHPFRTAGLYLQPAKLGNAALFLLPLAGLPLLGGRAALVAVPLFLAIFLSDSLPAYSYLLYYTLPAVPFLFFGAGEALLRLERWGGRRLRDAGWVAALAASLAATVLLGSSPLGRTFWDRDYALGVFAEPYHHGSVYLPTARAREAHRLLERIPSEASVAAQAFFLPHLARVRRMRNLPDVEPADYVLLDERHPNRYELPRPGEYEALVARLRADPGWVVCHDRDGLLLFARRSAPPLLP